MKIQEDATKAEAACKRRKFCDLLKRSSRKLHNCSIPTNMRLVFILRQFVLQRQTGGDCLL